MVEEVKDEIVDMIGCRHEDILATSGKTGEGVEVLLEEIIGRIPAPEGDKEAPLQAMIFDSVFNPYRGVVAYYRYSMAKLKKGIRLNL